MKFHARLLIGLVAVSALSLQAQESDLVTLQDKVAKGDPAAQLELGRDYHLGKGVRRDYAKAANLYHQAAAQGNAKAMYNLGYMLIHGQGVTVDLPAAGKWFQQAADQGLPAAQLQVGLYCVRGEAGYNRDPAAAAKWLTLAANGCDLPEQKEIAADALAELYGNGQGVPKDDQKALDWYLFAANLGDSQAQYSAGCIYMSNTGKVKQDYVQAYKWWKLASFHGNFMAIHSLSENLGPVPFTAGIQEEGNRLANDYQKAHNLPLIPGDYRLPANQVSAETMMLMPSAVLPPPPSPAPPASPSMSTNAAAAAATSSVPVAH